MTVVDRADPRSARSTLAAAARSHRWAIPVSVGVGVAVIDLIGAGIPSYWGDEAASVMSAQRSMPSLLRELSAVDAVHGLYYAVLHLWVGAFGAGEWATRALSVIATGVLAAGLVVLGRRWVDHRTGVIAGLLVAVIPRSSALAIEARGYAITEALAVWLVVLFLVLRDRGAPRGRWIRFGVLSGLAAWFFLYLLLVPLALICAALVDRVLSDRVLSGGVLSGGVLSSGASARRRASAGPPARGDLIIAALVAVAVALPIIIVAALQRHQVAFLHHRDYLSIPGVLVAPWFGHASVAVVLWAVIVAGLYHGIREHRRRTWVLPVLAWLIVPGLALIILDVLVSPTYDPRYLAVSLGAVALLAASGITGVLETLSRRRPVLTFCAAVLALLVLGTTVPQYLHQRTVYAKDGGADFRTVAAAMAEQAHLGDAVLFGDGPRPSRTARLSYRLYPASFAGLQDPQLVTPFDERAGLWDELAPVTAVASRLREHTVWLIESAHAQSGSSDRAALKQQGYALVNLEHLHRTTVYEFVKRSSS